MTGSPLLAGSLVFSALTIARSEPVSICLLYAEVETERGTIRETFELTVSTAPVPEAVVLGVVGM
jgi:hypothetical protein